MDLHGVRIACGVVAIVSGLLVLEVSAQTRERVSAHSKVQKYTPATKHRLAIQVDQNDKSIMDLALNNARNVFDYYNSKGEIVYIEIVAFGPGLHMLRSDTSPVKDRIAPMTLEYPNLTFVACGNTQTNQSRAEGKIVKVLSEAKVVPSGVVRLMELQREGYAYLRP